MVSHKFSNILMNYEVRYELWMCSVMAEIEKLQNCKIAKSHKWKITQFMSSELECWIFAFISFHLAADSDGLSLKSLMSRMTSLAASHLSESLSIAFHCF